MGGGIVPEISQSTDNKSGFTVSASSVDVGNDISEYGPFNSSNGKKWVAATGNANESLTLTCQYPISIQGFVIRGNLVAWKLTGYSSDGRPMILYDTTTNPLSETETKYFDLGFCSAWNKLEFKNSLALSNGKCSINYIQFF